VTRKVNQDGTLGVLVVLKEGQKDWGKETKKLALDSVQEIAQHS